MTLFMAACNEPRASAQQQSPREAELAAENKQLQRALAEEREKNEAQTRYVSDATKTINDVQDELNKITSEEAALAAKARSVEMQASVDRSQRDELSAHVAALSKKVRDNEAKIEQYRQRAKEQNARIGDLSKTIDGLQVALTARDEMIAVLRQTIDSMSGKVRDLEQQVSVKDEEIRQGEQVAERQKQTIDTLNEVYFLVGSMRDLQRWHVIRYVGGVFHIGRVAKVNSSITRDIFHAVDARQPFELELSSSCSEVRVVSEHDPKSWRKEPVSGTSCLFRVIKPDVFWRTKILVVGLEH
jgi:uncharacterized protein (DUF3084 family)